MKFKITYLILGAALVAFFLTAHSSGRAASEGWGNTGAPGDQTFANGTPRTCISCHGGNGIRVELDIELDDPSGTTTQDYVPGTTYDMIVRLRDVGNNAPQGFGFQIVALYDEDDTDVAGFSDPGSNVQIATATNTARQYAEHAGISTTNEFNFKWTAPMSGSGPITFYACGNGVNGNGSSNGDGSAIQELTVVEEGTTSTEDPPFGKNEILLYPNPAGNFINIEIGSSSSEDLYWKIFDANGSLVDPGAAIDNNQLTSFGIEVSFLPKGVYSFTLFQKENVISSQPLIKI